MSVSLRDWLPAGVAEAMGLMPDAALLHMAEAERLTVEGRDAAARRHLDRAVEFGVRSMPSGSCARPKICRIGVRTPPAGV